MRSLRLAALAGFLLVALALVLGGAFANSGGAPAGTAKTGCTCHGGQSSDLVMLDVRGQPVARSSAINFTVAITQGSPPLPAPAGENQGGLAVEASVGSLHPLDGSTQLRDAMLTHTAQGNDLRSWTFQWRPPSNNTQTTVYLYISVNSVNGDGANAAGDLWKTITHPFQIAPEPEPTPTPSPNATAAPPTESPGPGLAWAGAAGVAVAWLLRRRDD